MSHGCHKKRNCHKKCYSPHGKTYHKPCKPEYCCSTERYVKYNRDCFAPNFPEGQADLPIAPGRKIFILTCMDARVDPYQILGIKVGEAHICRNAGAVVTDDVIRSIMISQQKLGTREVVIMKHFNCGMTTFTDQELSNLMQLKTCQRPEFRIESFDVSRDNARENYVRVRRNPFAEYDTCLSAFVYMDIDGEVEGNSYCAGELAPVTVKDLECKCKLPKKNHHKHEEHHSDHECSDHEDHYSDHEECSDHESPRYHRTEECDD